MNLLNKRPIPKAAYGVALRWPFAAVPHSVAIKWENYRG